MQETPRRDFLKIASVIAAPAIIKAQTVTNAIKVGLVGAGGRGTGAASQALKADDYAELTAIADVSTDQINGSLARIARINGAKVKVADGKSQTVKLEVKNAFGRIGSKEYEVKRLPGSGAVGGPRAEAAPSKGEH